MTATTLPAPAPTATPAAPKDSLFGVCAAIGADFGFNPLWLRIAFASALLFSLEGVIAAYAALGLVVLVSRLVAPSRKPDAIVAVEDEDVVEPLRRAA